MSLLSSLSTGLSSGEETILGNFFIMLKYSEKARCSLLRLWDVLESVPSDFHVSYLDRLMQLVNKLTAESH